MKQALARAVSILGHPMLVLPLVATGLALSGGQTATAVGMATAFVFFAILVMVYSRWQVRRGHWAHVDASGKQERGSLNLFLLIALLVSVALIACIVPSRVAITGLSLSAALVLVAMLTARWFKLSLHMAFVMFAATLLVFYAPWQIAVPALAFVALVAWSRLSLLRHQPRDLVAGTVAGALAGVVFVLLGATGKA